MMPVADSMTLHLWPQLPALDVETVLMCRPGGLLAEPGAVQRPATDNAARQVGR